MRLKVVFWVAIVFMLLHAASFAAVVIPEGPWNHVNGVWVKVELPDQGSPWEWIPGHWGHAGRWVLGYWQMVKPPSGEALVWVSAHWDKAGKWATGHWKATEAVAGKHWISGHWRNGKWISGHWSGEVISVSKQKVWVPAHRGPNGRWISGHWEYK